MSGASFFLLPLLVGAVFGQQQQPPASSASKACTLASGTITCACRADLQVLQLTPAFMADGTEAETITVDGCTSVHFEKDAISGLKRLRTLFVSNTVNATFETDVSEPLQHVALVNVSELTIRGPAFANGNLVTVLLDNVHMTTVPTGAFAGLQKLQNVTFKDVRLDEVKLKAFEFQMTKNSEFSIQNSQLLGVQQGGIVALGMAKFAMRNSKLQTVGNEALDVNATAEIIVSDCELHSAGTLLLHVAATGYFRFVNNTVVTMSLADAANQLLSSGASLEVAGNTFPCDCEPLTVIGVDMVMKEPQGVDMLERNECDERLCGHRVPLRVLSICTNETLLREACSGGDTTTTTASSSTAPASTRRPEGRSLTAAPTAVAKTKNGAHASTVAAALLMLTVPAALAMAL